MRGKKVLLVDDDPYIREIMKLAFIRSGAQVVEASDGQEAIQRFHDCHPDLVILDLIMPFQDGWETCRKIRLHSNIPVIILTSLSSDREIIRGLETGADDFVSKPINIQVLLARAGAVLRRMKAEPQEEPSAIFEDDHLMIDLEKRLILLDGVKVNLTPTEFRLLEYLLTHC